MEHAANAPLPYAVRLTAELGTLRSLAFHLDQVMRLARSIEACVNNTVHDLEHGLEAVGTTEVELRAHIREPFDSIDLLSLTELQSELGISRGTLMKVRRSPDFPEPVHISGRRKAYRRRDIKAWVRNGGLRR